MTIALVSVGLAIPALWCATIFFVQFFWTRTERSGKLNDFFSALTVLLLIPVVIAIEASVTGQVANWFSPLSWAAVAGLVLAGVGQLLLIARVISLNVSFATGGLGILPFIAWTIGLMVLAFRTEQIPASIGWATAATMAAVVLMPTLWTVGKKNRTVQVFGVGLFLIAATAWLLLVAPTLR